MLVQYVLCPCHSAFEKGPARIETSGPEYFAISSLVTLVSKQFATFLCFIILKDGSENTDRVDPVKVFFAILGD